MLVRRALFDAVRDKGPHLAWGQMESAVRGRFPTMGSKPADDTILREARKLEQAGLIEIDRSQGRSRYHWKLSASPQAEG